MLGSGPFGELIAIEYFELAGGMFNFFAFALLLLNMINGRLLQGTAKPVGLAMAGLGLIAMAIYCTGLIGVRAGWLEEGLRPDRYLQNVAGTALLIGLGTSMFLFPRFMSWFDSWLDRRYPKS